MREPTTTIRFPERLHSSLKQKAAAEGVSIQEFASQVLARHIGDKPLKSAVVPALAQRVAKLEGEDRQMVELLVGLLEQATPHYLVGLLEQATPHYKDALKKLLRSSLTYFEVSQR